MLQEIAGEKPSERCGQQQPRWVGSSGAARVLGTAPTAWHGVRRPLESPAKVQT